MDVLRHALAAKLAGPSVLILDPVGVSVLLPALVDLRRVPAADMRPPAAAALLWSLLCSLDLLSAQRPKADPDDRDKEPGAKRQQPHIIFILVDDQVGLWGAHFRPTAEGPSVQYPL